MGKKKRTWKESQKQSPEIEKFLWDKVAEIANDYGVDIPDVVVDFNSLENCYYRPSENFIFFSGDMLSVYGMGMREYPHLQKFFPETKREKALVHILLHECAHMIRRQENRGGVSSHDNVFVQTLLELREIYAVKFEAEFRFLLANTNEFSLTGFAAERLAAELIRQNRVIYRPMGIAGSDRKIEKWPIIATKLYPNPEKIGDWIIE